MKAERLNTRALQSPYTQSVFMRFDRQRGVKTLCPGVVRQNAIDIATQAGALYDSFTNLTEELLKVGRQIGTVQNTYEGAMKKLTGKGNLIKRVEKLKKLGAKASKQIDRKLLSRAEEEDDEVQPSEL